LLDFGTLRQNVRQSMLEVFVARDLQECRGWSLYIK
jgi:hypothetical protein